MSPFLAMLIFSMVRVEKSSGLPPLVLTLYTCGNVLSPKMMLWAVGCRLAE
ncbi:Uncharacterised protein [Segatella copri]|nr:Uncharacterised protein [Segatella copri]